ncbi:sigma-E factor negative regulatory protein [Litorilituus lipolyticus]|uniref:Transcriptional regulator n=1 Tax=Litorilituus lipolyticus TaxID=2491017 RepID=A0A502KY44_9GAMM|nr:RseA family anti-sigma factor [Litorilituus lipolyticus]TPH16562.1 transcriptional regulator [Litorilituus lipolyticus]
MSESKFETISSLVDNYRATSDKSSVDKALDDILKDEHLTSVWQNYHLIGDVMREEVADTLEFDISQQISDAIAQEATILSPNNSTTPNELITETYSKTSDVTSEQQALPQSSNVISAQERFKAKVVKLLRPIGQVAIAASAAGLMIVGVQQNSADNNLVEPLIPSQVVQTVPLSGFANPVSFNVNADSNQQTQQMTAKQKNAQRIAQQRRFQALLLDHQQQVKLQQAPTIEKAK